MTKGRLEAFSDGVIAVIITIMVLELKVPHGDDLEALRGIIPGFLSYVLSFVNVGIYWNNHHHMLHATKKISGRVMWANLLLLFWLSLVPVTTGWVGDHPTAAWPAALYGIILFLAALSWTVLVSAIIARNGKDSELARAIGSDTKGQLSLAIYALGIALAFVHAWMADVLYALVALMWFVPDARIERRVRDE
jgi:uncharacterized membrane protein